MADDLIRVAEPDGTIKELATDKPGGSTKHREHAVLTDPDDPIAKAKVTNAAPTPSDYGVAVRDAGLRPNLEANATLAALNAAVEIEAAGAAIVLWEVLAGLSASTIAFEATLDGTNWTTITVGSGGFVPTSILASTSAVPNRGIFPGGYRKVRIRVSAYGSGSSPARLVACQGTQITRIVTALPAGTATIGGVNVVNEVSVRPLGFEASSPTGSIYETAAYIQNPEDTVPSHDAGAEDLVTQLSCDRYGTLYTHPHPPRIWKVPIDVAASGNNALKAAPGAGLRFYVTDFFLEAGSSVTPTLREDGGGTPVAILPMQPGTKWGPFHLRVPLQLSVNKSLDLNLGAAVSVKGYVTGFTGA